MLLVKCNIDIKPLGLRTVFVFLRPCVCMCIDGVGGILRGVFIAVTTQELQDVCSYTRKVPVCIHCCGSQLLREWIATYNPRYLSLYRTFEDMDTQEGKARLWSLLRRVQITHARGRARDTDCRWLCTNCLFSGWKYRNYVRTPCGPLSVTSHSSPGLRLMAVLGLGPVKPSILMEAHKSVHEHE